MDTADVDLFLSPHVENLRIALETLARLGFRFEAGGEPFLDTREERSLAQIVRSGTRVSAIHDTAGELDLMRSIAGFGFEELRSHASRFTLADTEILVGNLEQLLRSKEVADRPKDREFLRAFAARADDGDAD